MIGTNNYEGDFYMSKRILIPNTDLSVYPIGLGTADIGLKDSVVCRI